MTSECFKAPKGGQLTAKEHIFFSGTKETCGSFHPIIFFEEVSRKTPTKLVVCIWITLESSEKVTWMFKQNIWPKKVKQINWKEMKQQSQCYIVIAWTPFIHVPPYVSFHTVYVCWSTQKCQKHMNLVKKILWIFRGDDITLELQFQGKGPDMLPIRHLQSTWYENEPSP